MVSRQQTRRLRQLPTSLMICSFNSSRNPLPDSRNLSSNFFVQSQSQHAHGSVPFSCRQFFRACASFTDNKSKNFSQYGRSSSSGTAQKHVSTHCVVPLSSTRAC